MGVLERLVGILPILLLVVIPALFGLRRAVRRRRHAQAERTAQPALQQAGAAPDDPSQARRVTTGAGGNQGPYRAPVEVEPRQAAALWPPTAVAPAEARAPRRAPARPEAAPSIFRTERGGGGPAVVPAVVPEPPAVVPEPLARERGRASMAAWDRLASLPPIQRAIVFAEILAPPRGLEPPPAEPDP